MGAPFHSRSSLELEALAGGLGMVGVPIFHEATYRSRGRGDGTFLTSPGGGVRLLAVDVKKRAGWLTPHRPLSNPLPKFKWMGGVWRPEKRLGLAFRLAVGLDLLASFGMGSPHP